MTSRDVTNVDCLNRHYNDVNADIKAAAGDVCVTNAAGHRYIGCGVSGKTITIEGVPGNAMGAYLNGAKIIVGGNAQDACGDTMNSGEIVIYGSCGDTTGYGMRAGEIYIKGNVGYRVGIHMKEYQQFRPVIVVGGRTGDFLGEYQAGGIIVVLGIGFEGGIPVGGFPATGMHGGKIFIRTNAAIPDLPAQVLAHEADESELELIRPYVKKHADYFENDSGALLRDKFLVLTPNSHNPYKQFYVNN